MKERLPPKSAYSGPFLLALILHILVLAFLMIELTFPIQSSMGGGTSAPVIQASVVSQKALDQYEAEKKAQIQQEIAQKIQRQREAQLKQQEIQKAADLKAAQVKAAELKTEEQKAAELKAQVLKAEEQKAAQKALQKAEEKKQQQVQQQQIKKIIQHEIAKQSDQKILKQKLLDQKLLNKALKNDMEKQLDQDQNEINQNTRHHSDQDNNNTGTEKNAGEIDKYKSLVIRAISQQWIVPPQLPQNISCELSIHLAPGGVVLSVTVLKSSGNLVLDNSAIAAVNKASPLPVPSNPALFDQFRELNLTVKPDGSMTEN